MRTMAGWRPGEMVRGVSIKPWRTYCFSAGQCAFIQVGLVGSIQCSSWSVFVDISVHISVHTKKRFKSIISGFYKELWFLLWSLIKVSIAASGLEALQSTSEHVQKTLCPPHPPPSFLSNSQSGTITVT